MNPRLEPLASSCATPYSDVDKQIFENQLMNTKGAARYLGVSESLVRKMKARGELPFVVLSDRAIRFRLSTLNKWIEKRETIIGT